MPIQKMTANLQFKLMRQCQSAHIAIERSLLFLILLISFSLHSHQCANDVDEVAKAHAAQNLNDGEKHSFDVILIEMKVLAGIMSPKPTDDKMVLPQQRPVTYLYRLLLVFICCRLSHVLYSPQQFSISTMRLSTIERKWSKRNICESSLSMATIVSLLVDKVKASQILRADYLMRSMSRQVVMSLMIKGIPV